MHFQNTIYNVTAKSKLKNKNNNLFFIFKLLFVKNTKKKKKIKQRNK